jgi:hypothetical protein
VINLANVKTAISKINHYCEVVKCPKPILVVVDPDELMRGYGAYTVRAGTGCSIHLTIQALTRVDWLSHEACHCAHDRVAFDETGWLSRTSKVEQKYREDRADKCSQELLEQENVDKENRRLER